MACSRNIQVAVEAFQVAVEAARAAPDQLPFVQIAFPGEIPFVDFPYFVAFGVQCPSQPGIRPQSFQLPDSKPAPSFLEADLSLERAERSAARRSRSVAIAVAARLI